MLISPVELFALFLLPVCSVFFIASLWFWLLPAEEIPTQTRMM